MSIAVYLKNNLKNVPPSIGIIVNRLPYSMRPGLGEIYTKRRKEILSFQNLTDKGKQDFTFDKVSKLVRFSYNNVAFYKNYYDSKGFCPSSLRSFQDIERIPIIDKSILREYNIEARSSYSKDRYVVNTGGSSGSPFSFYIEPSSMGHEWAHMHHVWNKFAYKPHDLKLVFGGRSDLKKVVEYDIVRNHFAVDIYADYRTVATELKKILKKFRVKYLHGYPSSIYDFAVYCQHKDTELQHLLAKNLNGVFLGSEYPHERYRRTIENVFSTRTVSWYGHTERAILAYESVEQFKYQPLGTYGYAEAVNFGSGYNLVGTSFYNYTSPLIRYNTDDLISNIEVVEGLLKSFEVEQGREGEFVLDKYDKRISLTGLIFGRHHELFNHSKFIQVKQINRGTIEIHFVSDSISEESAAAFFDKSNIDLDIKFVKREEPHRTISGKVNLLIK